MATLQSVIDRVDVIKKNAFTDAMKTEWVNEIEGMVQVELLGVNPADAVRYTYPDDAAAELIVGPPWDKIYWPFVAAMVDFAHAEYSNYENTMTLFNSVWKDYAGWYTRTHCKTAPPCEGYYISAYGIAVKHGFEGSETDWLAALKGATGDTGPAAELRYYSGYIQWRVAETGTWANLVEMEAIQAADVLAAIAGAEAAQTGAEAAQTAAETAQTAAEAAQTAAQQAIYVGPAPAPEGAVVWVLDDGSLSPVLPDGGTAGQLLGKTSSTDYDTGWLTLGDNLAISGGILDVVTADAAEEDNTRPITSAAVHTEVGNIEVLLAAL